MFFCCLKGKDYIKKRLLLNHWPVLQSAPQPSDILWENITYSQFNVVVRRIFIGFISVILMAGSFIAIVYAKDFEKQSTTKYNLNGSCGNNITYT